MLKSLYVKNIALITELTVDFSDKLNVFSGETGAGKSIIIDSLNFMLGAKADKSLIRNGAESALVEGVFDISNREDVFSKLQEYNIERDDTVMISRLMTLSGKNEIRISGKLVTLTMLREISHLLVDVHGQSEHFLLSKVSTHLDLLDKFGGEAVSAKKRAFIVDYDNLVRLKKELNSFGGNDGERERLLDLYGYQIKDIEDAALYENEEQELNDKFTLISNVEKIATNLNACIEAIGGDEGAVSALSSGNTYLSAIVNLNDKFADLFERIKSCRIECQDVSDTLSDIADSLNFDEREADRIAERLEKIKSLKRKYGKDYAEINAYLIKTKAEYDKLNNASEEIERLNKEIELSSNAVRLSSADLTKARKEAAALFTVEIIKELKTLGMENALFEVAFKDGEFEQLLSRNGADNVEFMFSANLGEPLKPLIKVISGGEMSRFMLGLKSITAGLDNIETLVFDEIDTGISGKIAHVVAEKFIKISAKRQVIVITHLPQIAATGDKNFLIFKGVVGDHTETSIRELGIKEKIAEIVRLSGAKELSAAAVANAVELNDYYEKMKN